MEKLRHTLRVLVRMQKKRFCAYRPSRNFIGNVFGGHVNEVFRGRELCTQKLLDVCIKVAGFVVSGGFKFRGQCFRPLINATSCLVESRCYNQ